jgi:zinc protease
MHRKILILTALILFLASSAWGRVTEHVFPNGLKLLIQEDHKAPLAIIQVWYRVGSRNEENTYAGISHLLEHMMFKGTAKYGPADFSKLIQRNGGADNAYTTKDSTTYFETLASDRIYISFELESDRMQNLKLDPKEILSERDVVKEERRMRYEDDPQTSLYEEVIATAFRVHPYHDPVIGWMSTISDITPDALKTYYRAFYSPNNAYIVIAGDVDPEETIKLVGKYFGQVPNRPESETEKHGIPAEPEQKGEKRLFLEKEAELPHVMAAYHVPVLPDRDGYALEILSGILSGGKSSRFYKSLVYDKQLALEAYADYSSIQKDPFLFFVGGTPAVGRTAEELEKALYKEVERIKKEPPTAFELEKAKNQAESAFLMGQDSLHFQAEMLGMFELLGDWRMRDQYLKGIKAVTAAEVSQVAEKYLTPRNRTVGILVPLKANKGEAPEMPLTHPKGNHVQ